MGALLRLRPLFCLLPAVLASGDVLFDSWEALQSLNLLDAAESRSPRRYGNVTAVRGENGTIVLTGGANKTLPSAEWAERRQASSSSKVASLQNMGTDKPDIQLAKQRTQEEQVDQDFDVRQKMPPVRLLTSTKDECEERCENYCVPGMWGGDCFCFPCQLHKGNPGTDAWCFRCTNGQGKQRYGGEEHDKPHLQRTGLWKDAFARQEGNEYFAGRQYPVNEFDKKANEVPKDWYRIYYPDSGKHSAAHDGSPREDYLSQDQKLGGPGGKLNN